MQVSNIRIISTSHIAQQSVDEIRQAFEEEEPDFAALELDARRFQALMTQGETSYPPTLIARIGVLGYLFALIGGYMQKKLGSVVGTKPGVEMMTAAEEARKRGVQLYLIDQDVEITLRKLSERVGWEERLRLVFELFRAPFSGERLDIDLSRVPEQELIDRLTEELREKFPGIYEVLVEDRNELMSRRLEAMSRQNPDKRILAVVGAGHTEGLVELLRERLD